MKIIWKKTNRGSNAYVGSIRIGNVFWNAIDPANGQYKVFSSLPQIDLPKDKVDSVNEGRVLVEEGFTKFMEMLGINLKENTEIIDTLIKSCEEGIDGTWDVAHDEGGFEAMITLLERLK